MDFSERPTDRRWRWVRTRAAVAVLIAEGPRGPEVLLMERAKRAGDPWSGHVSFPGGFAHPADADDRATAARETSEELGLDLTSAEVLGRLPAHLAWTPREGGRLFAVTPVVFRWTGPARLDLSHEAVSAFWVPLAALRDPASATRRAWRVLGLALPMPGWRWGDHVIWGLTHRMLHDVLDRAA